MRFKGICFWGEYFDDMPIDSPIGLCRHPKINGYCQYSPTLPEFESKEANCPFFIWEPNVADDILEVF